MRKVEINKNRLLKDVFCPMSIPLGLPHSCCTDCARFNTRDITTVGTIAYCGNKKIGMLNEK